MSKEKISQEFRLKEIDETKNDVIEEIKQHELSSKKHKKVSKTLIYIEHLLILASTATGCVSFFAFSSLTGISAIAAITAIKIKICAIIVIIKKYK